MMIVFNAYQSQNKPIRSGTQLRAALAAMIGEVRHQRVHRLKASRAARVAAQSSPLQPRIPDVAQSHLFFLVLPNDLPETFCGSQTCRAIVVLKRDALIGVM